MMQSSLGPSRNSEPTTVQVVAPCDMEAGYSFPTNCGDRSFAATVPIGGVKKGDVFEVSLPRDFSSEVTPFLGNGASGVDPSHGKWNDSLFDCARYGYLHPSLCNAIFCPQLLMAQVLTRLKMNWWGEENVPDHEWHRTFRRIFVLVCLYWVLSSLLAPPMPVLQADPITGDMVVMSSQSAQPRFNEFLYRLVSWVFGIYTIILLTRLRRAVRRKYEIPLRRSLWGDLAILEDFGLAVCCGCCTVAQLARQTCDYDRQRAAACSSTGLGSQSEFPIIVV